MASHVSFDGKLTSHDETCHGLFLERLVKDPVFIQHVMVSTVFGAGVVLFGAGYAIFLALSRLQGMARKRRMLGWIAIGWYLLLIFCVLGLVQTLHLRGWWLGLVVLMLIGYFVGPRFIWRLSDEMHSNE